MSAASVIGRYLAVAAGEIGGYFPKDSPYGLWYGERVGQLATYRDAQYCAMFVSWCAEQAGLLGTVIPLHAYTPSGAAWFRVRGRFTSGTRGIARGDLWYSSCAGIGRISHVGIVERVYPDGSFDTIEGNTSIGSAGSQNNGRRVARKRRNSACSLGGYGRPDYASATTPEEDIMATKEELEQIVRRVARETVEALAVKRPADPWARPDGTVPISQETADTKSIALGAARRAALESGLTRGFVRLDGPDGTVLAVEVDGTLTPITPRTWRQFRTTPQGAVTQVADLVGVALDTARARTRNAAV